MIKTVKPYQYIDISLIKRIYTREHHKRYYCVDDCGNSAVIDKSTYELLKAKGVEERCK